MEKIETLEQVFLNFTAGGVEMDNRQFAKMAKDTTIIDKKLTATAIDLIFNKVKGNPSVRKINYTQFLEAIPLFTAKKGCKDEDVIKIMLNNGTPVYGGTKAGFVKFHDDKSTYTGVHTKGGPTTVDKRITLSNLADRSQADVRGVKIRQ